MINCKLNSKNHPFWVRDLQKKPTWLPEIILRKKIASMAPQFNLSKSFNTSKRKENVQDELIMTRKMAIKPRNLLQKNKLNLKTKET